MKCRDKRDKIPTKVGNLSRDNLYFHFGLLRIPNVTVENV